MFFGNVIPEQAGAASTVFAGDAEGGGDGTAVGGGDMEFEGVAALGEDVSLPDDSIFCPPKLSPRYERE